MSDGVLDLVPQVNYFHSKNIRIILWATSMVDRDSSNFQEAYNNGYFIKYAEKILVYSYLLLISCRNVLGNQALFSWWHGEGGLIDYTNENAVEWWHKQMDSVNCANL